MVGKVKNTKSIFLNFSVVGVNVVEIYIKYA
jgi:hypothetical protein